MFPRQNLHQSFLEISIRNTWSFLASCFSRYGDNPESGVRDWDIPKYRGGVLRKRRPHRKYYGLVPLSHGGKPRDDQLLKSVRFPFRSARVSNFPLSPPASRFAARTFVRSVRRASETSFGRWLQFCSADLANRNAAVFRSVSCDRRTKRERKKEKERERGGK